MIHVPDTNNINEWISEKFSTLAEILKDYDPCLELRWIPYEQRTRDDKKPYVVVDIRTNAPVHYASELDIPEQILAKIIEGDNKQNNVLQKLEAQETANKLFQMKKWLDKMEEAEEIGKFFLKSPLNTLKMDGKKFDDQRRVVGPAKDVKYL